MRKSFLLVLAIVLAVSMSGIAFAGNKNDLAYKRFDELDTASSVLTTDEMVIFRSDVPMQGITVTEITERKMTDESVSNTTDQTEVTAAETGKVFIAKQNTKFQLPAAAAGLTYTFVAGAAVEIEIQVSTTPATIKWAGGSDGDGSQGVIETGGTNTTGNSVTLVSDGTDWYVTSYSGEWTDGGTWQFLNLGAQS